jgi:hypothetical protein
MKTPRRRIVRTLWTVLALGLLGACHFYDGPCYGGGWTVCATGWCDDPCYDYGDCYWSTLDPEPLAPAPDGVW